MPSYYTYLIASLPMLHFGARLPISFEAFLRSCEALIPKEDIAILELSNRRGDYFTPRVTQGTLRRWRQYDTALRNELVKRRAIREKIDASRHLRETLYAEASVSHIAHAAYRNASLVDAERMLDQERWNFLDSLALGHYFDLDFLIVYGHKLLILERWDAIRKADRERMAAETLGKAKR